MRLYFPAMALLGTMLAGGLCTTRGHNKPRTPRFAVDEHGKHVLASQLNARKVAAIEKGLAAFRTGENPGPYVALSEVEKKETIAEAMQAPPSPQNWSEADKIIVCGNYIFASDVLKRHNNEINPWLTQRVNDVARLMHNDKSFVGMFVPCEGFNAAYVGPQGKQKNPMVIVYSNDLGRTSLMAFKVSIAHEIQHERQPSTINYYWYEPDADLGAANLFGPQAVIDVLEELKSYSAETELNPHGLVSDRQEIIRRAFSPGNSLAALHP